MGDLITQMEISGVNGLGDEKGERRREATGPGNASYCIWMKCALQSDVLLPLNVQLFTEYKVTVRQKQLMKVEELIHLGDTANVASKPNLKGNSSQKNGVNSGRKGSW